MQHYMRLALQLARAGRGKVEPNPMVGAVVIKEGRVVGKGYHAEFGGPHAEIVALRQAAREAAGATLFVSLEPCVHFGKTPPCVEAIISTGISQVVVAVRDPNPQVCGKGIRKLKEAGIAVVEGVLERDARKLNAPFFKYHQQGLPYVIAKWAMSLDGKIATSSGESKWISNENSRRLARRMRSEVQAIMVGVGTVLADNPMLLSEAHGARNPRRIIVDSHARTPLEANVVSTAEKAETIIAVTGAAPAQRVKALCQRGCRVLEIEACEGHVDLKRLCAKLCEMGIITVLIEGGGQLLASAIEQRLVDEVRAFVAPLVIGGKEARTPVEGEGIKSIAESLRLKDVKTERIDGDTLIIGYVAEGAADVEQE